MEQLPKFAVAAGQGELRAWLRSLPPFPAAALLPPRQGPCGGTAIAAASNGSGRGDGSTEELWRAYMLLSFLAHVRSSVRQGAQAGSFQPPH